MFAVSRRCVLHPPTCAECSVCTLTMVRLQLQRAIVMNKTQCVCYSSLNRTNANITRICDVSYVSVKNSANKFVWNIIIAGLYCSFMDLALWIVAME